MPVVMVTAVMDTVMVMGMAPQTQVMVMVKDTDRDTVTAIMAGMPVIKLAIHWLK